MNENENLEFKSSFDNGVIETLTAFANANGGKILVGVNEIKQKTEPSIIYLTHDIEKYGSGFIRVRKAIETYPTMEFNFYVADYGCVSEFKYSEQKNKLLENEVIFDISIFEDDLWLDTVNSENGTVNISLSSKILNILKEEPNKTQLAISEMLSISRRTVAREIKKLQKNKIIKRIGSDKNGYWEIN